MTIDRLNQYRALLREIEYYKRKLADIRDPTLRDSVLASTGPGMTLQEVQIYGSQGAGKRKLEKLYEQCKQRAERERDEIEAFMASVQDSQMRQIIRLRVVETKKDGRPLSWPNIAERLGLEGDGSTQRKQFERFMESFPVFPKKVC